MPRCEGLPDGPCPHGANNRSVKLTQGDLMLCPKCEAIRFPPVPVDGGIESAYKIVNLNTKKVATSAVNNSKLKRHAGGKSDLIGVVPERSDDLLSGAATEILAPSVPTDAVFGVAVSCPTQLLTASSDVMDLHQLQLLVQQQQCTILKLQNQLNAVLSFLGIDENDLLVHNEQCNNHSEPSSSHLSSESHDVTASDTTSSNASNALPSWSEVARRKRPINSTNNFQQSVVAAMYVDQTMKKSRETSLIVSGLEPVVGKSDSSLFTDLCHDELDTDPVIIKTKRMGSINPAAHKVQPLLVILREADQVRRLLALARQLRHSTDPAVRDGVYINPNLTKAEAEAAYQLRVKRRLTAQQRSSHTTTKQRSSPSPAVIQGRNLPDATDLQPATTSSSALNPLAGTFIPDVPHDNSSE